MVCLLLNGRYIYILLVHPLDIKQFKTFPVELEASFKLPLYLPSNITVLYTTPNKRQQVFFEVRNTDSSEQLYLNGKIKC